MVNSLSLIGLGLRNRYGLDHAGACFEKVMVDVVLSIEGKANRLKFPKRDSVVPGQVSCPNALIQVA